MRTLTLPGGLRSRIAPIAAISIFGLSLSMSYPLFALLLERAGASGTVIGLNTMASSLAMVICAPLLPSVLKITGIGPLMIGASVILALVFAAVPAHDSILWWTLLRFVYGFCATAIFFASEFWIVAAAPDGHRGRTVAIYAIALSVSFMLGPLIATATGTGGDLPFYVGAAIILAGIAPLVWGLPDAPRAEAEEPPKPRDSIRFFLSDPTLLWAVVLFGAIEYGGLAILSAWGIRAGMEADAAVALLAVFAFGSIVAQWPMGWAADRFDVRALLGLSALGAAIAPLALIAAAPSFAQAIAPMLVWGGVGSALYTVALTGLGARYSGQRLAQANAAVVLAYGLGALLSPFAFGAAMDLIDPHGLLIATALPAFAFVGLVLWRQARAKRRAPETLP